MARSDPAKHDRKRGRHKKRRSMETRRWENEQLPPKPPPWMERETASALYALRRGLDSRA